MDATVTAENKLWWPMSEALYATVLAFEVSGKEVIVALYDDIDIITLNISSIPSTITKLFMKIIFYTDFS